MALLDSEKQKYLAALAANDGRVDEYSLGEALSFTDSKTKQILDALEQEGKIEFQSFGVCSYRVVASYLKK